LDNEPFGENVEGLSYCGAKSCAIEAAVQKDDFKNSTLRRVVSCKPLLSKGLRKFKNFRRQLCRFIVRAVQHVLLQLDRREPVPHFRVLAGKRLLVDVFGQSQVEQPILLGNDQRFLSL
jgi:hypothetical protein